MQIEPTPHANERKLSTTYPEWPSNTAICSQFTFCICIEAIEVKEIFEIILKNLFIEKFA